MEQKLIDLVELHKVDLGLKTLDECLDLVPAQKEELANDRKEAQDEVDAKKEELDQTKKDLKKNETSLVDAEDKMTQYVAKLNQVKTNKEYDAAQKEIENQKKKIGKIEEDILVLFDEVEAAGEKKNELETLWKAKEKEFNERENKIISKEKKAASEKEELLKKRKEIEAKVSLDLLEKYNRIKDKCGFAVAHAEGEICRACFQHITAQVYNEVLKGDAIITCQTCQRILVHVEGGFEEDSGEEDEA